MSSTNGPSIRERLDHTIRILCPLINEQIRTRATGDWREFDLRKELVACVLGSQVRYESAFSAIENLEWAGLLDDVWWVGNRRDDFETRVFGVLSGQRYDLPFRNGYRFPKTRANQLVLARDVLARNPLSIRLESDMAPKRLRQDLVAAIPGLGPKQASMFLRNIGRSYELAILDTHLLRFMVLQELLHENQVHVGTLTGYERAERVVVGYADTLGYPAGYLDLAIWATMKAARELNL